VVLLQPLLAAVVIFVFLLLPLLKHLVVCCRDGWRLELLLLLPWLSQTPI